MVIIEFNERKIKSYISASACLEKIIFSFFISDAYPEMNCVSFSFSLINILMKNRWQTKTSNKFKTTHFLRKMKQRKLNFSSLRAVFIEHSALKKNFDAFLCHRQGKIRARSFTTIISTAEKLFFRVLLRLG